HPDDAEFGTAGTVAKLTSDGKEVVYCVASDGSKGSSDPNATAEGLITTRKSEQWDAAKILGVKDVCFLDFPDAMLEPNMELRRAIAGAIRRYKPDVLICQCPTRDLNLIAFAQHPDHLATGEAALAAAYPTSRDRMTFPELLSQGLEPHGVREVWVVGSGSTDHYIDISETLDKKAEALRAHASQLGDRDTNAFVRERAKQVGEPSGIPYAEGFKRLPMP
ncbi:MAG: PIG-L family deacetylase, partial [Chloroflexi bacterium]